MPPYILDLIHQYLAVPIARKAERPLQPGSLGQDVVPLSGLDGAGTDDTGTSSFQAVGGNCNQMLVNVAGDGQHVGNEIWPGTVSAFAC